MKHEMKQRTWRWRWGWSSGDEDDTNRVVDVVADRIRRFAEEMRGQQDVVVVVDEDDSESDPSSPNDTVVPHN